MKIEIVSGENRKRAIIERLSRNGAELGIYIDEEPRDTFKWKKLDNGAIAIVPPYDYGVLSEWWYVGNWQAVSPPSLGYSPVDTFRTPDEEIEERFKAGGLTVLIDSFHDDTDWKVVEA